MISNNYSAEYGHSTGGIVTMSTRSGTNDYHGSLFESLQNNDLNARNFFAKTRPPARLNQFGGSLGGPIQKDKTHFFVTWEQTRQLSSDTVTSTVPTLLNRGGDFSDIANKIYDPLTNPRVPFAGNRIPLTQLDPVALAALNYFPTQNLLGLVNNFVGSSANNLHRDIVVGRLDHYFSSRDTVTARYYINDSNTHNSGTYGIPASDPLADITDVRVQSILIAHTHTFGPTLANDLRFTYLRRKFIDSRPGVGENLAAAIGLTGVSDAAFPAFTIPGYGVPAGITSGNIAIPSTGATFGNPTQVARYQTPILDRQILDAMSWYHGKHAFKFGAEARFGANTEIRDRGSAGNFSFSAQGTGLGSTGGNSFATFLLGNAYSGNIQVSDQIPSRASYVSLFVQDDFRVTDQPHDQRRPALGSRTAEEGGRQQTEFVRSAGDQPGIGHSWRGHFLGCRRHSGTGFRHGLEQLRAAARLRLSPAGQERNGIPRRSRDLLRPNREQHHRRCGFPGFLHLGQLLGYPAKHRDPAQQWVPGVYTPATDARIRRRSAGSDAEHFSRLLQSESSGSDFLPRQFRHPAGSLERSGSGGRVYRKYQPSLDRERFPTQPGIAGANGVGRRVRRAVPSRSSTTSLGSTLRSAIRPITPGSSGRRSASGEASPSWLITRSRNSSTMSSQLTSTDRPAATWILIAGISTRA